MSTSLPEAAQLLQEYFTIESLNNLLFSKIKRSKAKGIDKITFDQFRHQFKLPTITIKQASVDRFINSIIEKFSYFKHNKVKLIKKQSGDLEKVKSIFILELNEKITGAISDNKCYGWVFYYNAINELSILYKIDKIIARQFDGLKEFNGEVPANLKKLSKAYYEGKFNLLSGYIHNYNKYKNIDDKIRFLSLRGEIEPKKGYTKEGINELYERVKARNLSQLEKDNANIY